MPTRLNQRNLFTRLTTRTAVFARGGVLIAIAAAGLAVTLPTAVAPAAAPEPAPIPVRWELDLNVGPLRVANVRVPGEGDRLFYYLTYSVGNFSGRDLLFAPSWELATDETLARSGRGVPLEVTDELLLRLDNPLLTDETRILGTIQQGEENIREGLVVWPVEGIYTDEVTVYATGFSGENYTLRVRDAETGRPARVVLRKTMMLRHETPGEIRDSGPRPLQRVETRWIMR
jgi:hypothetical protein